MLVRPIDRLQIFWGGSNAEKKAEACTFQYQLEMPLEEHESRKIEEASRF